MGAELLVPGGVAVALVSGGVTYLIARRTTSGQINTSEAADLWAASKDYQTRMDVEMEKLRDHTKRLDNDYVEERRLRLECERRLTSLEARSDAAVIIEAARVAAEKIRDEAASARMDLARESRVNTAGFDSLARTVDRNQDTLGRIESDQTKVAADLADAQKAVDGVAQDLADSHRKADEVPHDQPAGTAADAASRQTEAEKQLAKGPE